ncbi:hypothetical protein NY607_01835 [Lysinibacillus sp. A4]|uniref:hypothetical protein n=1 Tax=Lysinibacillus sp. A4 TaxID=2976269 RepID=UPI0021760D72|nr:hypothetical protein [Lysinibacillus sp. A4]MCS5499844.1 hypothetical protein [Lysinibacillus sp. A4]
MIFEVKKPGKKIKDTLAELGSDYEIKRVDLWNNIYRDLGNGYELFVGEVDNTDKDFNVSVSVYQNKPNVKSVETISNIKSTEELRTILNELVIKYY